jgi:hypothetical protein
MNDRDTHTWALFVDIMGFADALEDLGEHEQIALRRAIEWGIDTELPLAASVIAHRYRTFHSYLHNNIKLFHGMIHSVIEFSDSAYIIATNHYSPDAIAVDMMRYLFERHVPVRIGLGHGSFMRMSFATSSSSEGLLTASTPFMGTAIVRAYRAQACRARGFRIFVHPKLAHHMNSTHRLLPLPEHESDDKCTDEINFLLRPGDDEMLRSSLQQMREGVTCSRALLHYDGTYHAITRLADDLQNQTEKNPLKS